jgi:predicted 3-demethylubiquinone-9 3-methyltransferase (glyoxalase superfamily)
MQRITPFLWFDGQAEEAMHFYVSIFKNSKVMSVSPGPGGKAMSVKFQRDGQDFMGLNGGPQFSFTPAISLFVSCETQQEVDELWDKLTAGGGKAERCGWLKDKFGLSWRSFLPPWADCWEIRIASEPARSCRRCSRWTRSTSRACSRPTLRDEARLRRSRFRLFVA